jgi:hypothetical protein
MSQAWSVFLVLAVGAGVAVVIGVLEVLYYRKLYTGVPVCPVGVHCCG